MRKSYLKLNAAMMSCLLVVLATFTVNAQEQSLNSPVAHYTFNETSGTFIGDSSGTEAHAVILTNADSSEVEGTWVEGALDGALGGAMEFDGTQYVSVPVDALEMYSDLGSVSIWAAPYTGRIRSLFSSGPVVGDGGGFGPLSEMHLHLEEAGGSWAGSELSYFMRAAGDDVENDSTYFFLFSDPDKYNNPEGGLGADPETPIQLGDSLWHHVVATWGDNSAKMYIDGELVLEEDYVPLDFWKMSWIRIGSMLGGGRSFVGKLDDVRIYDWVLLDEDVTMLYENNLPDPNVLSNDKSVTGIGVYPNPAVDALNVDFIGKANADVTFSLMSLSGQILRTESMKANEGANTFSMNVSAFQGGIYLLRTEIGGEESYKRVILK